MRASKRHSTHEEFLDHEADVVVVGTGFAGLAAANAALDRGASVMMLEKSHHIGGNSIVSGGVANAVNPERQEAQGIRDSIDLFYKHTLDGGDNLADPDKVRFLVEHALEGCIHYLENLGVSWSPTAFRGFGSLFERSFAAQRYQKWKGGAAIVHALYDHFKRRGGELLLKHRAVEIVRQEKSPYRIVGIKALAGINQVFVHARCALILAGGGFAANREMVSKYRPDLAELGTSNRPTAKGDCIAMAEQVGAALVHMQHIQASLGKVQSPAQAMLIAIESEEVRKSCDSLPYKIFINRKGERFIDEGARRDVICAAALKQEKFQPISGKVVAQSITELNQRLGMESGTLDKTIQTYNDYCDWGKDQDFAKDSCLLIPLREPPFVAETLSMLRHYTMGGVKTQDVSGKVIDRWGEPIHGLYAVGEVTGGVHGSNRLGNSSLSESMVFGTACGRHAVEDIEAFPPT